jgi:hypothetical protein
MVRCLEGYVLSMAPTAVHFHRSQDRTLSLEPASIRAPVLMRCG